LRITPLIRGFKDREVLNAVRFIVMTVTYIVLIPYLGFLLTSLIYMLLVQVVYGVSTFKALGISVSMVFFIYILFIGILKVVVPEPILGSIVFRWYHESLRRLTTSSTTQRDFRRNYC
jgi:hypothetical protein